MNKILAAIDNSAASGPVVGTAFALVHTFGAEVEVLQVADAPGQTAEACARRFGCPLIVVPGDPLEQILNRAADDDIVAVVVGTRALPGGRRPAGHLALELADRLDKPVVMVPPGAHPPDRVERVLIAMEGTPAKAFALRRAVGIAADAGLDLVVVHVDDQDSIPRFSDQVQHEYAAYSQEFLARFCHGAPAARLESRIGVPADEILAAAADVDPALLALGWPQTGLPGRGSVVREVLDRSPVPVLLVAVA